jgi:CheY-like chemotaxis protein
MTRLAEMSASPLSPESRAPTATILMVEDNAEVRLMGEALLIDAGFTVHTADDADGALAMVESGLGFDLLFTDIVMPGTHDGLGLADAVARLRPGTPILLTTGWADRARDPSAQRPDADLIAKPYRQIELVRKIEAMLKRKAGGV